MRIKKKQKMFFQMINQVKDYSWGSKTSLNQLFGLSNPYEKPQAELWMGANKNGCSAIILSDGNQMLLSDFIAKNPEKVLSKKVSQTFAELPFLFKVLAAESPLSVQVHPSKSEAELGYQREFDSGININAFERNYKDSNHKPELIYALTPYEVLNGFRSFEEIEYLLSLIESSFIRTLLQDFSNNKCNAGLEKLFKEILSISGEDLNGSIMSLMTAAQSYQDIFAFQTVLELSELYPQDVGLFSPLILNVITLDVGQAMFLNAGTPHAYLRGTGLEIMANSDNVLRAGLTSKHIDVEELIKCTDFRHKPKESLFLQPISVDEELYYQVPVEDFSFCLYLKADDKYILTESAEILLSLDEDLELNHANGETIRVKKGESVFVPAYARSYNMTSLGRVARVFC